MVVAQAKWALKCRGKKTQTKLKSTVWSRKTMFSTKTKNKNATNWCHLLLHLKIQRRAFNRGYHSWLYVCIRSFSTISCSDNQWSVRNDSANISKRCIEFIHAHRTPHDGINETGNLNWTLDVNHLRFAKKKKTEQTQNDNTMNIIMRRSLAGCCCCTHSNTELQYVRDVLLS